MPRNTCHTPPIEERVIAYIDGFNFYHGMMAKGWGRYRWLDYQALIVRRMREGQTLAVIKYLTSLMNHQPDKAVPRGVVEVDA